LPREGEAGRHVVARPGIGHGDLERQRAAARDDRRARQVELGRAAQERFAQGALGVADRDRVERVVDAHERVVVDLAGGSVAVLLERDARCFGDTRRPKARHVAGDARLVAAGLAVVLVLLVGDLQDEIQALDDLAVAVLVVAHVVAPDAEVVGVLKHGVEFARVVGVADGIADGAEENRATRKRVLVGREPALARGRLAAVLVAHRARDPLVQDLVAAEPMGEGQCQVLGERYTRRAVAIHADASRVGGLGRPELGFGELVGLRDHDGRLHGARVHRLLPLIVDRLVARGAVVGRLESRPIGRRRRLRQHLGEQIERRHDVYDHGGHEEHRQRDVQPAPELERAGVLVLQALALERPFARQRETLDLLEDGALVGREGGEVVGELRRVDAARDDGVLERLQIRGFSGRELVDLGQKLVRAPLAPLLGVVADARRGRRRNDLVDDPPYDAAQHQEEKNGEGDLAARHVQAEDAIATVQRGERDRHEAERHVRPEPRHHRRAEDRQPLLPRSLPERIAEHHGEGQQRENAAREADQRVSAQRRAEDLAVDVLEKAEIDDEPERRRQENRHRQKGEPRQGTFEKPELALDGALHPARFLGSRPMTMLA
jgi:hypothetical protein